MKTLLIAVFAMSSLSALAAVDCTVTLKDQATTYQRVDMGPMVSRFKLKALRDGVLVERKYGLNMMCDSSDLELPATVCTLTFVDTSELVDAGSFKVAKKIGSMTFNPQVAQNISMDLGDATAGEDTAVVNCTVK